MGQDRRTTQNLEIIQIRESENLILIKGSIPGAEGDYVIIREAKKISKGSPRHKMIMDHRAKLNAPPAEKPGKGGAAKGAPAKAVAPAKK